MHTSVSVTYDVMTIRNPYDSASNTKINEVTLQLRLGTSGSFTTLAGIEYRNNTVTQTGSGVTTPQNPETKTITLPDSCSNRDIVQLRWVRREVSGSGYRPSFAVDNIQITGTYDVSLPVTMRGASATVEDGKVVIRFATASEIGIAGFNVMRALESTGPFDLISGYATNPGLAVSGSATGGASYYFADVKVSPGMTYYYQIQVVSNSGKVAQAGDLLEVSVGAPASFVVHQNFPNPFNPVTAIFYELPAPGNVSLKVFDAIGRVVETLVESREGAGFHTVKFNGSMHPSGVYFYSMRVEVQGGQIFSAAGKMVLSR